MSSAIRLENLKKYFGAVKAVDGISMEVEEGSLFAFLGLNGAGKSTTINIMCSLLPKDGGKVWISGCDLDADGDKIRRNLGVVFQNSVLDGALTVRDNLTVRASYYGLYGAAWRSRLEELTDLLDLSGIVNRPYGKLSGGERRRADVARGLLCHPRILVLDEPTTGLDPQSRRAVWAAIGKLRKEEGMTVFLTTHYMEEAARADKVVILDGGKIAAEGSPSALKDRYSGDFVHLYRPRAAETDAALAGYDCVYEDNRYRVKISSSAEALLFLSEHADLAGDFEVVKGDMDDVFLRVTGKRLSEEER